MSDMQQDIGRLGRYVSKRRDDLGLSQEYVAEHGGPSTTTLSKIELGTAKRVNRGTLMALDRALGWRAGSASDVAYGIAEPVITAATDSDRLEHIDDAVRRYPEPDDDGWMIIRAGRDERGSLVLGTSVSTDADGVSSRIEVRYWPGEPRTVQMGAFPEAVTTAHRLALEATSVYRAPASTEHREEGETGGDTAPTNERYIIGEPGRSMPPPGASHRRADGHAPEDRPE